MIRRRLPGFRFESPPLPAHDMLPRMDIAVFVGFAATGPLHCPVAVEDPAAFAAVFGADAPLAWDTRRGEQVYAYLAPAVRAFLRNGGKRCWVIRVADETRAKADRFMLPGVLRVDVSASGAMNIRPACAYARSQGQWADSVRVGTALTIQTVVLQDVQFESSGPRLHIRTSERLRVGDLLRLRYSDGLTAMLVVEQLVPTEPASPTDTRPIQALGRAVWLAPVSAQHLSETASTVTLYRSDGNTRVAQIGMFSVLQDGVAQITLTIPFTEAPAPGTLIRINTEPDPIWLNVQMVVETIAGLRAESAVQMTGVGMCLLSLPAVLPSQQPVGERLLLELQTHTGSEDPIRLSDLDFAPGGDRWWGALPTDAELFDVDAGARRASDEFWRRATWPRFPLAGRNPEEPLDALAEQPLFTFPLGIEAVVDAMLRAAIPDGKPLERDGLAEFCPDLFLDPALADALTGDLLIKADFIRYLAPKPRSLRGIHTALSIDEATIIAVPDAAQRPWDPYTPDGPIAPDPMEPLERPEWWRQRGCAPQVERTAQPPWGEFLDCGIAVIAPPVLTFAAPPDLAGTFTLTWTAASDTDAVYILEEATRPDFASAVLLYRGDQTVFTLYGRPPGDYYYRVRVEIGINTSDWSLGTVIRIGAGGGWKVRERTIEAVLSPPDSVISTDLLSVQRALLRLCAAHGHLFAVLALPNDAREDAAIAHAAALRPSSYGGVYHPWLITRDQDQGLRQTPPDGAICGVLARRALARGAWIAPANERLRDVVALTPPLQQSRWLDMQAAQVNLIRNEPYGFVSLSADTLATDPDLLPINVRRLLSLLRRLTLRLGADFVFEPNDDGFRRLVQRDIEAALAALFTRGAFAGRTPDSSYRVIIRSTPQDVDNGRLIVDVMVAPSLPLVFLTVRLVQSGGRVIATEER